VKSMLRQRSRSWCFALAFNALSVAPTAPLPQQPKPQAPRAPARPPPKPAQPSDAAKKPAPAPTPPPPDLVVKTRYASGDTTTASTVSARGRRERIDYGTELTVIAQCDTGRLLQVNDEHKRFLSTPLDPSADPAPAVKPPKKGGVITYTTAVTDLGDRKAMFGTTARHAKIAVTKEVSADACDRHHDRVETDGWFIDSPQSVSCSVADRRAAAAVVSGCRDEIKYVDGDRASVGYPVAYTTVTATDDGKVSTMTMEVTSFERQTLPDALFTVADDYKEVHTLTELTAGGPKRSGARVGVVPVTSQVRDTLSLQALGEALVVSLTDAKVDAVAIQATTAADAITEARENAVDFVLMTEVTDLRKPARGVIGRVSGQRDFGAKVDFLLVAPGAATPLLSSSERSGSSALQTAVTTARNAQKYLTPFGLLESRFDFMKTFTSLTGANPSVMQQSPDPVLNTVFLMLGVADVEPPHELLQSGDAAVAAAMEKEVAAVAAKLPKDRH
jgi:hypothetical protein